MTTPQTLGELEAWLAEASRFDKRVYASDCNEFLRAILHGTTCEDCGGSGETSSVADNAWVDPCPSCNNGRVGGFRQRLYENADLDRDDGLNIEPALTIELNPKEEG